MKTCVFFLFMTITLNCSGQVYFEDVADIVGIDHYTPRSIILLEGLMSGGAAWLDHNNDGWEDLYLTGGPGSDKFYKNNGNGTFEDLTFASGISLITENIITAGVATADIDRNGFEDIVITTAEGYGNLLLMNNGDGTFSEEALGRGLLDVSGSAGVAIGDFDQDGWLDLYFANWRDYSDSYPFENGYPDRYYSNNGDGTFTDVTTLNGLWSDGGCGLAAVFSDFDLDGDPDLLLANDFGVDEWADENRLYANQGGVFNDVSDNLSFNTAMHGMGVAVGDFDEDSDFDYYMTNIGKNVLLRNDLDSFSDQAENANVLSEWTVIDTNSVEFLDPSWSWGTVFLDYDNDSDLDLFVSNGQFFPLGGVGSVDEDRFYGNISGSGVFEDLSVQSGMNSSGHNRGCAAADYDGDGDVDVVIVQMDSVGGAKRTMLMRNEGGVNNGNWLEFSLTGVISNLDAIGSVLYLYVDGRVLMREVDSGGASFLSHNSKVVHFGLGNYETVDSVTIVWPNGNEETLEDISVNQKIDITEGSVLVNIETSPHVWSIFPNPVSHVLNIRSMLHGTSSFNIISCSGQLIRTGALSMGLSTIDVRDIPTGIYVLELIGVNDVAQAFLSIQHQKN